MPSGMVDGTGLRSMERQLMERHVVERRSMQVLEKSDIDAWIIAKKSKPPIWNPSWDLFAWSILSVILWMFINLAVANAPSGDTIEQFNWSKSFELGYWKHPPFSTNLLSLLNYAIGIHEFNTTLLDFISLSGTLFFAWRTSCHLLGSRWGGVSALLTAGQYCFSVRSLTYNHNNALLLTTSACIYLTLHAVKSKNKNFSPWLLSGAMAGLSFLSKYQAVVPLAGVLVALMLNGDLKNRNTKRCLLVASAVMLSTILPHLLWIYKSNGLILGYTTAQSIILSLDMKLRLILAYLANQLKFYWTSALALIFGLTFGVFKKSHTDQNFNVKFHEKDLEARNWLIGLCATPLALVILVCLFGSVRLEDQWGYSFSLFYPTAACWYLRDSGFKFVSPRLFVTFFSLASIINAGSAFTLAKAWSDLAGTAKLDEPYVLNYPARAMSRPQAVLLSRQAFSKWNSATHYPLKYIIGDTYLGGIISLYSVGKPTVTGGDEVREPWVSKRALAQAGYLLVTRTPANSLNIEAVPPKK